MRFLDYLKKVLIPPLHQGDVVIVDNMRSYHVKGVVEVLCKAGMIPLDLPPYSLDLNPIEMIWLKIKAILRKRGCRRWLSMYFFLFRLVTVWVCLMLTGIDWIFEKCYNIIEGSTFHGTGDQDHLGMFDGGDDAPWGESADY